MKETLLVLLLHLVVQWKLQLHEHVSSMNLTPSSMTSTRTLINRVQQNRSSHYRPLTGAKRHGSSCPRPSFWRSLFGVLLPPRLHPTRLVRTPLTFHRLPFRFWYISRILHIESTVCRFPKYSYHWNLRFGRNVPFFAIHIRFVGVVSPSPTSMHRGRTSHHVPFFRTELVEPDRSPSDCQPGNLLCYWGSAVL
jgi:hypothetical protein